MYICTSTWSEKRAYCAAAGSTELIFFKQRCAMKEPIDSLNFQIGWFKASAVGRFTIVSVLTFLLVLVGCAWVFGLGQLGKSIADAVPPVTIGK